MIVEIKVRQNVDIDIPVGEIIEAINEMPIHSRLNEIAALLNGIDTDDIEALSPAHKALINNYLKRQIERFGRDQEGD